MKIYKSLLIIYLLTFFGCAKIGYIPELVTLEKFSKTQDSTDKYVDRQEELFKQLRQEIIDEKFEQYNTKTQIRKRFGEPVFVKPFGYDGRNDEMWMYRRPVNYFDSDKVFVYFDKKGNLVSYQLERYKEQVRLDDNDKK